MTTHVDSRRKHLRVTRSTFQTHAQDVKNEGASLLGSPDRQLAKAPKPCVLESGQPIVASRPIGVGGRCLPIPLQTGLRRACEKSVAVLLLALASPVLALLALAVRVTSPGEVLYSQTRSGIGGKEFQILKFRSMRADAEKGTGAVWATKDDPRVTVIGYWLRKLHLDELPQLINIARGEMAFVGPRPERPQIIAELEKQIPGYRHRLDVLPGVTGLAQINLDPDESVHSVKRKFELDIEYIFISSTLLDLRVVLTTLLKMCGIPKELATSLTHLRRVPLVPQVVDPPSVDCQPSIESLESILGNDAEESSDERLLETVG